jgi:hypothetical protein
MAAWPGTLPAFWGAADYQEQEASNLLTSPNDIGPPKRRRRTTAGVRGVMSTVDLTEAQYQIMRTFFIVDCAHGALSFTRTDAHGTMRTYNFERPISYTYQGYDWWQARLILSERY